MVSSAVERIVRCQFFRLRLMVIHRVQIRIEIYRYHLPSVEINDFRCANGPAAVGKIQDIESDYLRPRVGQPGM